jgi:peptide chain release factor subunit 1
MQRLKLYNKVPPNGLVLYCGTVLTDEGKEKQVCVRAARVKTNARE